MKKFYTLFASIILISTVFSINVSSRLNENPEIKDELGDAILGYIDIISVSFYENSDESGYLYIKMELKDLSKSFFGGLYQVEWTYNDIVYASFLNIGYKGKSIPKGFICGKYGRGSNNDLFNMPICEGSIDKDVGIIIWKIPKINIGNPQQDDILKKPWSKSCFSGIYGLTSFIRFIPFLGRDLAPTFIDEEGINRFDYGRDYILKY
jgi:hypothetical protein